MPESRIAVIGDVIMDHTVFGEPSRVAQEAPIVVYRKVSDCWTNGGAAGVRDMLIALGHDAQLLHNQGVKVSTKHRLVAVGSRNPTIVSRVDEDVHHELSPANYESAETLLRKYAPTVVLVSDYGKGMVTERIMQIVCGLGATVVVDPNSTDWSKYAGADIILPSRAAATEFLQDEDLRGFSAVVTKLDQEGCRLYGAGPAESFPSSARQVVDVTGAGDQFMATIGAFLRRGLQLKQVVSIANLAAGMQVEHRGVVPIVADQLQARINEEQGSLLAGESQCGSGS